MDIAEFVLKMFTVGFFIAGILGMILQSISFQGQMQTHDNLRLAIDFANAAAAAPCLAQTIGNDVRKGVIDYEKIPEASKNFCLSIAKPYKLRILEAGKEIFTAGDLLSEGTGPGPFPVLIKRGENYTSGVIDVRIA